MVSIFKKIYYHDTDLAGVVYYANYLKYFEEARTEYILKKGLDLEKLYAEKGILFVVKKVDIDYKAPAKYSDLLEITAEITNKKNVSLEFLQEAKKDKKILVVAKTILVCVDTDFHPKPIPQDILDVL